MHRGHQEFEEYSEDSDSPVVVRRDPALANNALLPGEWGWQGGDTACFRAHLRQFRSRACPTLSATSHLRRRDLQPASTSAWVTAC